MDDPAVGPSRAAVSFLSAGKNENYSLLLKKALELKIYSSQPRKLFSCLLRRKKVNYLRSTDFPGERIKKEFPMIGRPDRQHKSEKDQIAYSR